MKGMFVMVYAPELSVVALRERPLTEFESVTVALTMTAPVGSATRPEMVPAFPADWMREGAVRFCEEACARARGATTESAVARMTNDAAMPRRMDVCMSVPLIGCLLRC